MFARRIAFLLLAPGLIGCFRNDGWGDDGPSGNEESHCASDPTRALCDDFEGTRLSDLWIPNVAKGTAQLDSQQVHSGDKSLHLHVDGIAAGEIGQAFMAESTVPPGSFDRVYARGYYYLGALSNYTIGFIGFGQGSGEWKGIVANLTAEAELELISSVPAGDRDVQIVGNVPVGEWFCFEWQIDFAPQQQVRIWVDDNELSGFNRVIETYVEPPMTYFQFGPMLYYPPSDGEPIDVWVDDVVLDDERIGCE